MRKVALIVLFNKEKKILLQHRTDDAPINPSKWGFFGGKIKEDETPLEAVKRECLEELDYQLTGPKLVHKRKYGDCYSYIYVEAYNPKKELILREGQAMGWFSLPESKELDSNGHILEILYKIFDEI
ncbi:MAG: NUDIX domain-containing protein [Candidatus Nanoarchaeia archaeon]|nr:NUDIX domain-containing protein [Candidatus Nanoarchaeia archaeon]MDD5740774.1 NUDIX domain-containing protein [Candidatus Nanoarchaeia archaeon]